MKKRLWTSERNLFLCVSTAHFELAESYSAERYSFCVALGEELLLSSKASLFKWFLSVMCLNMILVTSSTWIRVSYFAPILDDWARMQRLFFNCRVNDIFLNPDQSWGFTKWGLSINQDIIHIFYLCRSVIPQLEELQLFDNGKMNCWTGKKKPQRVSVLLVTPMVH